MPFDGPSSAPSHDEEGPTPLEISESADGDSCEDESGQPADPMTALSESISASGLEGIGMDEPLLLTYLQELEATSSTLLMQHFLNGLEQYPFTEQSIQTINEMLEANDPSLSATVQKNVDVFYQMQAHTLPEDIQIPLDMALDHLWPMKVTFRTLGTGEDNQRGLLIIIHPTQGRVLYEWKVGTVENQSAPSVDGEPETTVDWSNMELAMEDIAEGIASASHEDPYQSVLDDFEDNPEKLQAMLDEYPPEVGVDLVLTNIEKSIESGYDYEYNPAAIEGELLGEFGIELDLMDLDEEEAYTKIYKILYEDHPAAYAGMIVGLLNS